MRPLLSKRFQGYFIAVVALAACQTENAACATDDISAIRDRIEAAWSLRHSRIRSFDATYSLTEVRPGRKEHVVAPNDSLREFTSAKDEELKLLLRFAFEGGRIAFNVDGDVIQQDGEVGRRVNTATFNGKEYRTLVQGRFMPMGSFDRRGLPGGQLTRNIHQVAIWLWYHPNQLMEQVVWDVANMEVGKDVQLVNGEQCWRLRIPRNSPRWVSYLYVDQSDDYLPRQWDVIFKGVLKNRVEVEYQKNDDGLHYVSKWRAVRFSEKEVLESMTLAQVQECRLNDPIDDDTFELKFPIGTHLHEELNNARRYFIQEESGMRPINEGDFGAIEEDVVPIQETDEKRVTTVFQREAHDDQLCAQNRSAPFSL